MIEPSLVTGSDGQDFLLVYIMDDDGEVRGHYIEVSLMCLANMATDAADRVRRHLSKGDKMG